MVLPLGWGMLYADAARCGLDANLEWSVEETYDSNTTSNDKLDMHIYYYY